MIHFSFFVILIYALFVSFGAFSAYTSETRNEKVNLFEMKRKLDDQSKKILLMTKEMNQIENALGSHNKKYLKLSAEKVKLEETLANQKKNADFDSQNLKKNYSETKNILMGIVLNKIEKSDEPSDLLARKILIQQLQAKLIDLSALMEANNNQMKSVDDIYKRLQSYRDNEKNLVSLMSELEQKKKELRTTIENEHINKLKVNQEFSDVKNKMAEEKDSQRRMKKRAELAPVQVTEVVEVDRPVVKEEGFSSPLLTHQGIEHNQKGVTFKFLGKNEVLATKAGKITYTGSLANFGNVVMIDHGGETRTVLLGQFDYAVKKGDLVSLGQVIGVTTPKIASGIGDGKIYFEVRKNNLAQNTYLLLDKKTLTSH